MSAMPVRRGGVMHGKSRAAHRRQHQNRELNSNCRSHSVCGQTLMAASWCE